MKRFYTTVALVELGDRFGLHLDGRPVRTPMRALMAVPCKRLAEAIADEWQAQGEQIDPRSMPLTGLANAAIDRFLPGPASFAASLLPYGDSDVLLYRSAEPEELANRQVSLWNPILDWAERQFGVEFVPVVGIVHQSQPPKTLAKLAAALNRLDPFRLVAMQPLVTITGSIVIALALEQDALSADAAWAASELDELYQAEHWGEDELAVQARQHRRESFTAALEFLRLLSLN